MKGSIAESQYHDGAAGEICKCECIRVPTLPVELTRELGPWPEIAYYADCWLAVKCVEAGYTLRVTAGYDFVHHWHQYGRLDSNQELMAASEGWREM